MQETLGEDRLGYCRLATFRPASRQAVGNMKKMFENYGESESTL